MKNTELSGQAVISLMQDFWGTPEYTQFESLLKSRLSPEDNAEYESVCTGKMNPSLSSDILAKHLFSPETQKDRLNFLLQGVTGDTSIDVSDSLSNEGVQGYQGAKKVIFDIPIRLLDSRRADVEIQVSPQDFILKRGEIYSSDMLMMQYGVSDGEAKGDLDYSNVQSVILVMLMKRSPDVFKNHPSDRYIHRFNRWEADSGLCYTPLRQVIYVQLDKALQQLKQGSDGENNLELQLLLAAMADSNDEDVVKYSKRSKMIREILEDARKFVQDKEVQAMILAEKYAQADLNAIKSFERREERTEIFNNIVKNIMARDPSKTKAEAEKEAKIWMS